MTIHMRAVAHDKEVSVRKNDNDPYNHAYGECTSVYEMCIRDSFNTVGTLLICNISHIMSLEVKQKAFESITKSIGSGNSNIKDLFDQNLN